MSIELTREVITTLRSETLSAHPRECCGILTGSGMSVSAVIPTANVHAEPQAHFEIDPQALVDAHRDARSGGPEVVGYYHSHPTGPARPSAEDEAMASRDGRIWAILDRNGDATFWRDGEEGFEALSYRLAAS